MRLIYILIFIFLFFSTASANPYQIRNDIDEALKKISYTGRHDFDVEVKGGTVKLSGFVSNSDDKIKVEKVAAAVKGVDKVESKLTILGGSIVTNSEVAKTIRDRVKADSSIKNYTLNIEHKENNLTLAGEVINTADREKIFSIAYSTAPNANIINKLRIASGDITPDNIVNERVLDALKAEGVSGIDSVVLDTADGIVTFNGQVKNHRDIDRMLSIALMVDGVKSVRSEVKVLK